MQTIEKIYDNMAKLFNKLLKNSVIPNQKYKSVKEIDLNEVRRWKKVYNIEGVILDIDGTLRKDMEDIDFSNLRWLTELTKELKICMVSNGFKDKRIEKIAKRLDIMYIPFALKPLNRSFLEAAKTMNLSPKNVIVVGDEYLADIFGGNRNNMMTVMIDEEMER